MIELKYVKKSLRGEPINFEDKHCNSECPEQQLKNFITFCFIMFFVKAKNI